MNNESAVNKVSEKSQIFNAPKIMIAAPKSGSGKTTLTCALLQLLKNYGKNPVAFKCGPDYIDPMFHEKVLGVPSTNLDSYFCTEEQIREIFTENMKVAESDIIQNKHDAVLAKRSRSHKTDSFSVIEGVMGLFDGLGGTSLTASSYDIARITKTPILLVIDAQGASRSIVPLVKGFLEYDRKNSGTGKNLIKGIFLNKTSQGQFQILKKLIEEECAESEESAENRIKVIGFLPKNSEENWQSRHLGLILPSEIKDLQTQIQKTAESLENTLDFEALEKITAGGVENAKRLEPAQAQPSPRLAKNSPPDCFCLRCRPLPMGKAFPSDSSLNLAVALDEAFCFYYHENLRLLEEAGFQIKYFSPLHDKSLPEGANAILLGGGYPELYAELLESNESMRKSIKSAIEKGASVLAECGGFMYLQEKLFAQDRKSYEMCGAIKGECTYTGKLARFGYAEFTKKSDFSESAGGEKTPFSIKGHEFHYFDSTNNGTSFKASKPLSNKSWDCMIFTPKMLAGFPHLYYRSNPKIVKWFVESCKKS